MTHYIKQDQQRLIKNGLNSCYKKIKKGKQFERRKIALSLARTIRNNDIISSKKIAFEWI